MFGLGAGELLIILVFALLFIGPKKLPELARGLGKGLREFQKAKDDLMDQIDLDADKNQSVKEQTEIATTTSDSIDNGPGELEIAATSSDSIDNGPSEKEIAVTTTGSIDTESNKKDNTEDTLKELKTDEVVIKSEKVEQKNQES